MRLFLFPLSLFLCFALLTPGFAQTGPVSPALAAALQAKLDQERTTRNLKGMSATLHIPGEGTWKGVSGVSHAAVPIDSAMVFGIGSITKTFVATVILQLQEDSLLHLSDSLHQWLPSYPNVNPNLTIKQLLQQRSGLYNYTNNPAWGNAVNSNLYATWTADSVLNNYILPPVFTPGAYFGYSNTNYALLGRIIEEVTDTSWWEVMRNRLLTKYQLSSVYAEQIETPTGIWPHNWQVSGGTPYDISFYSRTAVWTAATSAGMLAANAADIERFARLLFQGQILEPASLTQMTQIINIPAGGSYNGYGLGVMRYNNQGKTAWGHGGNIPGFAASMVYSPSDSISVSVLINQDVNAAPIGLAMLRAAQQFMTLAAPVELVSDKISLSCYPNPFLNQFTIQFYSPKNEPVTLTLHDAVGKIVQQKTIQAVEGENGIDFNFPKESNGAGIYLLQVQSSDNVWYQRLIRK